MGCLIPFGRNGCTGCVGCTLPLLLAALGLLGVAGTGWVKARQTARTAAPERGYGRDAPAGKMQAGEVQAGEVQAATGNVEPGI